MFFDFKEFIILWWGRLINNKLYYKWEVKKKCLWCFRIFVFVRRKVLEIFIMEDILKLNFEKYIRFYYVRNGVRRREYFGVKVCGLFKKIICIS